MIFYIPHLIISLGAYGLYLGGWFTWIGFSLLFVILPFLEWVLRNQKFQSQNFKSSLAEGSLFLTSISLTLLLVFVLIRAQNFFDFQIHEKIGFILSGGSLLGAFGITSAHEMVHRRKSWQRAFGVYNLSLVNFAHWGIEHVFGHHKWAATPVDPATARKDEWLYTFWFRSYFGVLRAAFHISKFKVTGYWLTSLLVSVGVYFIWGGASVLVWWLCSAVAILLLETVDYIEHYGLIRPQNSEGHYTAFKPLHSWDSEGVVTNATLFNLGFHSHHHMKPLVPFEDLLAQNEARQMPYGYSIMVPLALLPFVYIPLMNSRLAMTQNKI